MNKKRAKFNFCFVLVLLVVALVLCFVSFKMPASTNNYNGLFNSISTTNDISTGNTAVYEITGENVDDKEIEDTVDMMRSILMSQNFSNVGVYRMGNYIKAEVNSTENASNVLAIIGSPKSFYISGTNQDTITEDELETYAIVGTDVKNAFATTQFNLDTEYNGITIEFNANGATKLHELSRQVAATTESKIYFYIDGTLQTSLEIQETNRDYLSFYSSGYSEDTAKNFALQILMSSTGVNLQMVTNGTSSAIYGQSTIMFALIALLIVICAVLVLFPVYFKELGLVADLSLLVGGVITIFLLQALPITTVSSAGILGVISGFAIMSVCHLLYLKKMKSEFYYLKRLQLSAKTGFKKSWLKILDICVISFISGFVVSLWNIPFVSTFGICLATGAFVALFESVVIFKDFVTWYVSINNKNYKKVNFTKGEENE